MARRRMLISFIFGVLFLVIGGCGSDGNSTDGKTANPPLTQPTLENDPVQNGRLLSESGSYALFLTPDNDKDETPSQSPTYTVVTGKLYLE